jgi:hypothetical protein
MVNTSTGHNNYNKPQVSKTTVFQQAEGSTRARLSGDCTRLSNSALGNRKLHREIEGFCLMHGVCLYCINTLATVNTLGKFICIQYSVYKQTFIYEVD